MRGAFLRFLLLVAAVVVLTFALPRAFPGDPTEALGDTGGASVRVLPEEARAALRAYYGLDRPLPVQFGRYLVRLEHLDLGQSFALHRPVRALIGERLPYTLALVGTSLAVSAALGIALGILSAWRAGSTLDRWLLGGFLGIGALPEFLVGLVLIVAFAVRWPVLPASGATTPFLSADTPGGLAQAWDRLRHFVLPGLTLTLGSLPHFFYLMRNATVPVRDAPYLVTARAKGLTEGRLAARHAARSAVLPVVSLFGIRVAFVVGGVLVVERLFGYPGVGLLMVQAVWARDYPVLEGCFLLLSLSVLAWNLLVDGILMRVDPRIREAE
ncbi:MAG TPA: ABC transporter permease [bacterium]|nr:ABC transporter permease [bacterium]